MGKDIKIRDNTYEGVPSISVPKAQGGGVAQFYDTGDADAVAADVRNGKKFFNAEGEEVGSMAEKAAATYAPSKSQQVINGNQYLAGAQTIEAVTVQNLQPSNIVAGVTVKVGTTSDDDSIASVAGTAQVPIISQDSTTKILSIS